MTGFSKVAIYRQELPPSGGYSPIPWARVPGRRIPLWPFVSLWLASNIFGYFYHIPEKREYWRNGKRKIFFFPNIQSLICYRDGNG